jgi:hypothetical protein
MVPLRQLLSAQKLPSFLMRLHATHPYEHVPRSMCELVILWWKCRHATGNASHIMAPLRCLGSTLAERTAGIIAMGLALHRSIVLGIHCILIFVSRMYPVYRL